MWFFGYNCFVTRGTTAQIKFSKCLINLINLHIKRLDSECVQTFLWKNQLSTTGIKHFNQNHKYIK